VIPTSCEHEKPDNASDIEPTICGFTSWYGESTESEIECMNSDGRENFRISNTSGTSFLAVKAPLMRPKACNHSRILQFQ